MPKLDIMVRSRVKMYGTWETEWADTVHSWRRAWSLVDDCCADRLEARKYEVSADFWILDIGGEQEYAERKARTDAVLASADKLIAELDRKRKERT
jgi:hypothetical protein